MSSFPISPKIMTLSWGKVSVEGRESVFKDVKLFPGGCRGWDWNETGTRHEPGIQPADVEELLSHGSRIIVLSRGMWKRLHICSETLEELATLEIPTYSLQTEDAVRLYNSLCTKQPVGALIHSTC